MGAEMIGASFVGGLLNKWSADEQYENQQRLMGLQAKYNEQAAQANHERAKDLWTYTNYENQVAHLKAAGLNPALLYGIGGAGGGSASGAGSAAGVSQGQAPNPNYGGGIGMGLQSGALQSQIKVNESIKNKNDADAELARSQIPNADKLRQLQDSMIELNRSQAELNGQQKDTLYSSQKLNEANYEVAISQRDLNISKVSETVENMLKLNAEKRLTVEQTKWYSKQIGADLAYKAALTAKAYSDVKVNEEQVQKMGAEIQDIMSNIINKRMTAEAAKAYAEGAVENMTTGNEWRGKELKQRKTEMIVDGVLKAAGIVVQWSTGVANTAAKVIGGK